MADASAWIAYFSGEPSELLEAGLAAGLVAVPALVRTELLGNSLEKRDRRSLEQVLDGLPTLGLDPGHFSRAGALKARLEGEGIALSARDAHILQCALDRRAVLVSRDPLFRTLELSTGVKVQM